MLGKIGQHGLVKRNTKNLIEAGTQIVETWANDNPGNPVEAVYLWGSVNRGDDDLESDIDIVVCHKTELVDERAEEGEESDEDYVKHWLWGENGLGAALENGLNEVDEDGRYVEVITYTKEDAAASAAGAGIWFQIREGTRLYGPDMAEIWELNQEAPEKAVLAQRRSEGYLRLCGEYTTSILSLLGKGTEHVGPCASLSREVIRYACEAVASNTDVGRVGTRRSMERVEKLMKLGGVTETIASWEKDVLEVDDWNETFETSLRDLVRCFVAEALAASVVENGQRVEKDSGEGPDETV